MSQIDDKIKIPSTAVLSVLVIPSAIAVVLTIPMSVNSHNVPQPIPNAPRGRA